MMPRKVASRKNAELKTHGDAADDAERKRQRKNFYPERIGFHPFWIASAVGGELEHQQHPR
jgi:hypothetical protein